LRLTPLDPRRPAPDLLEDLLTAIDGCFLVWRESADLVGEEPGDPDDPAEVPGDGDGADDGDWYAAAVQTFSDELRGALRLCGSPA
jgi:hypothetical protein